MTPPFRRVLHDAELTGAEGGLRAIAHVEFGEDVGDVVLDGAQFIESCGTVTVAEQVLVLPATSLPTYVNV